jgi:RNA polymerase sigma-70 factor, ECF subfamily
MPDTRQSLIVRIQDRNNQPAWSEFVAAYEPFLKRLVRRQGAPQRHVADVVQQLLLAIARSVDRWHDDGRKESFRRWLQRVARNVVIKFMTRERRQFTGRGGTEFLEQLQQATDDDADDERRARYEHELIVWAAEQVRGDFLPSSWQAFWATQIEGRPVAEVARELALSPGSIYMSRSRILARIRTRVQEMLGPRAFGERVESREYREEGRGKRGEG